MAKTYTCPHCDKDFNYVANRDLSYQNVALKTYAGLRAFVGPFSELINAPDFDFNKILIICRSKMILCPHCKSVVSDTVTFTVVKKEDEK